MSLARRDLLKGVGLAVAMTTAEARAGNPGPKPGRGRTVLPTGAQYEIRRGNRRAVVTEVGATLRSYQVGRHEFLDTFAPEEMSRYGMGHILAPWPGRIDHGRYAFQGVTHQLPINEVGNENALHGLVRYLTWKLVERSADAVTLSLVLFPTDGYPFTLELVVTYRLGDRGLVVQTKATNIGAGPLPFGLGFHPYFAVGTEVVDSNVLTLPAATYLPTNERLVPIGAEPVAGTAFDFRNAKAIGAVKLDTTYTDLIKGDDGRVRISLANPGGKPSVELILDGSFSHVVCYTQDTLPVAAHRRRGICIEPLTCAPNAFNSGRGLLTLEPLKSHRSEWSLDGSV
ncbi:MAG: aldose 1-epimerase family protein [Pseudomonadota bacterium]